MNSYSPFFTDRWMAGSSGEYEQVKNVQSFRAQAEKEAELELEKGITEKPEDTNGESFDTRPSTDSDNLALEIDFNKVINAEKKDEEE